MTHTIEVMEYTNKGLAELEVFTFDTIFRLSTIKDKYPAHEVTGISFLSWGAVVYLIRKIPTRLLKSFQEVR
jgi:hypothetical protein